jgi:coenzyme F420-reducing hydrogenase gamma subunit
MSIPVVEIEHKKKCHIDCVLAGMPNSCAGCQKQTCAPDCPACAVEANNKAWAKYLTEHEMRYMTTFEGRIVAIPHSDWEQITEKVDG